MIRFGLDQRITSGRAVIDISEPILPGSVTAPVLRWSARDVDLDSDLKISKIYNVGTGGSTYDATPTTVEMASIAEPVEWGGKKVLSLPDVASLNYDIGNYSPIQTCIVIATYKTGVETTFSTFNALTSSGNGASFEIEFIGSSGNATLFPKFTNIWIDGVDQESNQPTVLPMDKMVLGGTFENPAAQIGNLFSDNFSDTRNWVGYVGEILCWETVLTSQQIADVSSALSDFYAQ